MTDVAPPSRPDPGGARAAPDRGVLWVSGPDAKSFLHGVLSCDVEGLTPETARYGALLTPQGKITAEVFLLGAQGEDGLFIDAHADCCERLLQALMLRRLRAKVTLEAAHDYVVIRDWPDAEVAGAPDPRGSPRRRSIVSKSAAAGVRPESEADRISDGLPTQGKDYGPDSVFPTDVNLDLLQGVDYAKGCFIGQEVVSRMRRRGVIRKRTLIARGAGFAVDAPIHDEEGAEIGVVSSWHEGAALVRVRLDRLRPGARLSCAGEPVTLFAPSVLPAEEAAALETLTDR